MTRDKSFPKMMGTKKNMFTKVICNCDESPVIIHKIQFKKNKSRLARGVGFEVKSKGRERVLRRYPKI